MSQYTQNRLLDTNSSASAATVHVSVIVCTRNRCDSLQATLATIGQAVVPPGWKMEVLIVDNGSTDSTKSLVLSMSAGNASLHYISEPRKGKCYAYNTGVSAAKGDIFLFTDDDVKVPVNWVEEMCRPITTGMADAVAGGVVFPPAVAAALSTPPLLWRLSWFASSEALDPKAPSRMIGANMAFHRRVLQKVPGFDVELGPGALGFGDETLFSRQLLAAKYRLVGALDVTVEHHFDLSRLTNDKLLAAARDMGRTHAFVFHHWEHQRSRLFWLWFSICKIRRVWIRALKSMKGATRQQILLHELDIEKEHAFYSEYRVQTRRRQKYAFHGLSPISFE